MPAWARASTSLIALVFCAVRSSSSLVLLIIGVVCSLTYFLLAQPTDATMLAASASTNEVRFMCLRTPSSNFKNLGRQFDGFLCLEIGNAGATSDQKLKPAWNGRLIQPELTRARNMPTLSPGRARHNP